MKSILYIIGLFLISCSSHLDRQPVNTKASAEAKALYKFLISIRGKYTLSGEHNFVSSGSKYNEIVHDITGKYPVIWGCDFSFCVEGDNAQRFHHCGPMNLTSPFDSFGFNGLSVDTLRNRMIAEAQKQYSKGQIITLMWHNCFPTDGDTCNGSSVWAMENRPSPEQWDSLVTNGTTLNMAWKKQADGIAKYLKILRDAHVPVLWRPYHEMNGVWFWWCNQKGENGFKKLWIMMYDYFTNDHQLNNLLWVWNTNAPREKKGDEAFPYADFYPGDEYVDVLAADIYQKDYKQSHHDELVQLGAEKPIAMGEVGDMPNDSIISKQPQWTWFMVWGYFINMRMNKPEDVKKLYESERVLTLDEIERNGSGEIRVK